MKPELEGFYFLLPYALQMHDVCELRYPNFQGINPRFSDRFLHNLHSHRTHAAIVHTSIIFRCFGVNS